MPSRRAHRSPQDREAEGKILPQATGVPRRLSTTSPAINSAGAEQCNEGYVAKLRHLSADAEACVGACEESCGAVNRAIDRYMTKGGEPAARPVICQEPGAFRCPVRNEECSGVLQQGKALGIDLGRWLSDCGGLVSSSKLGAAATSAAPFGDSPPDAVAAELSTQRPPSSPKRPLSEGVHRPALSLFLL